MRRHHFHFKINNLNILLLLCCCFCSCQDDTLDKEKAIRNIKNVLVLETQYMATQEFEKMLELYNKSAESTIIFDKPLDPGKVIYARGYDAMKKVYGSFNTEVTNNLTFSPPVKSDWNINIEGSMAWCTFIDTYKLDRLDGEVYRTVILKKIGDGWKIVNSNVLVDEANARLKIPISEFPAYLQPFFNHWGNEVITD